MGTYMFALLVMCQALSKTQWAPLVEGLGPLKAATAAISSSVADDDIRQTDAQSDRFQDSPGALTGTQLAGNNASPVPVEPPLVSLDDCLSTAEALADAQNMMPCLKHEHASEMEKLQDTIASLTARLSVASTMLSTMQKESRDLFWRIGRLGLGCR